MYTTIQLEKSTREKLNRLRIYKRATYDEIINALMGLIPEGDEEGKYTEEFRASLLRSMLDIRHGVTYGSAEVRAKLGL
jgi:DNA-binding TFAR19-related protein (PDSD5 family)